MTPILLTVLLACGKDGGDTGATRNADDTGDTGTSIDPTMVGCEDRHATLIAAVEADLAKSDAPGVSVAVMEDGVVTCRFTRGTRAADSTEPPTVDTLFQIGSTTKMFTATALLQQVDAGELSLDDTLAEAYPDSEFALDETWNDQVLLRHLLTHQGAFYDYIDLEAGSDDADLAAWHEEVFFPNIWLMNPPGKFWNYSNPNFDIAGLIVEAHDSRWYPDIMRDDVFGPLGMTRTIQRKTEVEADGDYALGVGYYLTGSNTAEYGPVPMDLVPDIASGRPAGVSTWSTPDQVLAMARFLMEGDSAILSDALRQQVTSPQVPFLSTPDDAAYGFGVMVFPGVQLSADDYYELPVWSHGGNTNSYSSELYIVPDQGFAISILSSGYGTDFSGSVVAAFESLVDLPTPVAPPEYPWDPDGLDANVGHYTDPYNVGGMDITRKGDQLYVSMPLLDRYGFDVNPELYPLGTDVWLIEIDGAWYDLTFIEDEGSDVATWVRNRAFVTTRQATDKVHRSGPPPSRAEIDRLLRAARLPTHPVVGPRPPGR
ncbi:MAG: class A beta-lactamase-related serine hydrolase [Deltaproteobacteria bacterium]|nr:MAG: class A beta-lactamase-related serine hydrolase [Deltaproteobacteria bacterium]